MTRKLTKNRSCGLAVIRKWTRLKWSDIQNILFIKLIIYVYYMFGISKLHFFFIEVEKMIKLWFKFLSELYLENAWWLIVFGLKKKERWV